MSRYLLGVIISLAVLIAGVWYLREHRRPYTSGEVTPRPLIDDSGAMPY